jgi:hypothetical protein
MVNKWENRQIQAANAARSNLDSNVAILVPGAPRDLLMMICHLRWPPRFTLRSLFIATTFLAVLLGMIAWLDRAWIGK